MRKRDVAKALDDIRDFPHAKPGLEQYRTPPAIAMELLWEAHEDDAIEGKAVVDLGCGTGTFALGAHLLGAASVVGVDADGEALSLARDAVPTATFVEADVSAWDPVPADTVFMNPPFGAQRKHADRPFYEAAMATGATTIWFLAQPVTQPYLLAMAREAGRSLEKVGEWDYSLPASMEHHTQDVATIRVGGYRLG